MTQDQWYTTEEAAELLKVSVWTIRGWLRDGSLEGRKVGRGRGQWRIPRHAVIPKEPKQDE